MEVNKFKGVEVFQRKIFQSELGYFANLYENFLPSINFVQDSVSYLELSGTIKGMHLQTGEMSQSKLVTCLSGKVLDFFIDLREESETYCKFGSIEINSDEPISLFIPRGFAHGYITLEPKTTLSYKLDNFYSPEYEETLLWNDPSVNLPWPKMKKYHVSKKDQSGKSFEEILNVLKLCR